MLKIRRELRLTETKFKFKNLSTNKIDALSYNSKLGVRRKHSNISVYTIGKINKYQCGKISVSIARVF